MGKKKGISGSTLKIIAIITMLIDHTGGIIVERIIKNMLQDNSNVSLDIQKVFQAHKGIFIVDNILRYIGRLSFPLFCFLLVEGFCYTKNRKRYVIRLLIFSLVSEIPFNLAFHGEIINVEYQNVFFTLSIGFFVMMGLEWVSEKMKGKKHVLLQGIQIIIVAAGVFLAYFLKTDYSAFGVMTITVMYIFRQNKMKEMISGCMMLSFMSISEITVFFTLIPAKLYNGSRGLKFKYIFYFFYPVHLMVLYVVAYLMGYGNVMMS